MDESLWTTNYSQWLDTYMRNTQSLHYSQSPISGTQNNPQVMAGSQHQGHNFQTMGSSSHDGNMQTIASCSQPTSHFPAAHFGNDQCMPPFVQSLNEGSAYQDQSASPNQPLQAMASLHLNQGQLHLQPGLSGINISHASSGPSYPFPSQLGVRCHRCMSVQFICCICWKTFLTQSELQKHLDQGHQR